MTFSNHCSAKAKTNQNTYLNFTGWSFHLHEGEKTEILLCSTVNNLLRATFVGEWLYTENDYQKYLSDNPDHSLTESEFQLSVKSEQESWVQVAFLKINVEILQTLLSGTSIRNVDVSVKNETIADFEALYHAIENLELQAIDIARINIS
jgi:hypothetical protein